MISRGNERSDIFIDKVDRNGFSDAIEEMSERFEIDVFDSVMFLSPYPYNFPVSQSPSFYLTVANKVYTRLKICKSNLQRM